MQRRKAVDFTAQKPVAKRSTREKPSTPTATRTSFEYFAPGKNRRPERTGRRYDGDAIVAGDAWVPHGVGVLRDGTSTVYAGDFVQGKPHGIGTLTFDNGDVYEGEMRNGELHGVGKCTAADAKKSETVLYRHNRRVCFQHELKPGIRLRISNLHSSTAGYCAVVHHVRGWKYAVLLDDYTQRELVLSAFDFEILREQPPLYSIEHGLEAVSAATQNKEPLNLRCLTEDENIFDVDA